MDQPISQARKLMQEGKLELANEIFLKVLEQDPNNIVTLYLLGTSLGLIKKFTEGIHYLNKSIELQPLPEAYHNLGLIYQETGEWQQALECYQKALNLNPNYHQAYHKLGNTYNSLGDFLTAVKYFEKSLTLKPDYAEGWLDFGIFLSQHHRLQEAKECYDKALQYRKNFPKTYLPFGKLLLQLKLFEQSVHYLKLALDFNPGASEIYVLLAKAYEIICDWTNYEERQKKLLEIYNTCIATNAQLPFAPFGVLTFDWEPQMLANVAKNFANLITQEIKSSQAPLNFNFSRPKNSRLKVGYISGCFHQHPNARHIFNLFAAHDRKQFEIFVFSHGANDNDQYRQHFSATAEHFMDIATLSDVDAAKLIYENNIDILIDLDGYCESSRFQISALRPAPLQVCYLGFPGTTGADFIDYFIADATVITPATAPTYNEKIIYLPECYQINNDQQITANVKLTRQQYNLPEKAFVFCCFNQNYKIEPKIFAIWMAILTKVPEAVLWLYSSMPATEKNLRHAAEKAGVDPKRIIFAKDEEHSIYLARLQLADLFLDTHFYNAHTTASDALRSGLPVLTYPGVNFPSRVAASLLKTVGMPELIMSSLDEYRDRAIFYAQYPQELQKIRQKLVAQIKKSSLFNTKEIVKNLEKAYLKIWEIYQNGQAPQNIWL